MRNRPPPTIITNPSSTEMSNGLLDFAISFVDRMPRPASVNDPRDWLCEAAERRVWRFS